MLNCMLSPEYIRSSVQHVREGPARAGRDLNNFAMGVLMLLAMSKDEQKARDAARPVVAWVVWLFARQPSLPILAEAGLSAENVQCLAESPRPLPELITDDALSRFAVVGSPSRCRDAVAGIIDAGITHPVLGVARIDEPKQDAERRVDRGSGRTFPLMNIGHSRLSETPQPTLAEPRTFRSADERPIRPLSRPGPDGTPPGSRQAPRSA